MDVLLYPLTHYLSLTLITLTLKFSIDWFSSDSPSKVESEPLPDQAVVRKSPSLQIDGDQLKKLENHLRVRVQHLKKIKPILEELRDRKNRLGDNIDKTIENIRCYIRDLKSLRPIIETNNDHKRNVHKLRYELLVLIKIFLEPKDLSDFMERVQLEERLREKQDEIFNMRVEVDLLEELLETFKRLSSDFDLRYEELCREVAEEKQKDSTYCKQLDKLEKTLEELDLDSELDRLKDGVKVLTNKTDRCYKKYINIYNSF